MPKAKSTKRNSTKVTRPTGNRAPGSKEMIEAARKEARALEMRLGGNSYKEIADEVGFADRSGAYRAFRRGLEKSIQEPADEYRKVHRKRLETLFKIPWEQASTGDADAIQTCRGLLSDLAKLLGVNAPEEHKHSVQGQVDVSRGYDAVLHILRDPKLRALAERLLPEPGSDKT